MTHLVKSSPVVSISYQDLVRASNDDDDDNDNNDDDKELRARVMNLMAQAFGGGRTVAEKKKKEDEDAHSTSTTHEPEPVQGMGILAVTNVPQIAELRRRLLPLARQIAVDLSDEERSQVTSAASAYQVGWSHGKERVEGDDKFDVAKGSYYANPLTDNLVESLLQRSIPPPPLGEAALRQLAQAEPAFFAPNIWPSTSSLVTLEPALKEMALLIHQVGMLVARQCDCFVASQCPTYPSGKLEQLLRTSLCCKARLLHYFPAAAEEEDDGNAETDNTSTPMATKTNDLDRQISNWCGWHNDHGSLTGLVPGMYMDHEGKELEESPDPWAGLYVRTRSGELVHVQWPPNGGDTLAFQMGETAQIHTGGILQATPHAVRNLQNAAGCRGGGGGGISRESFAVFMEPEYHCPMDIPDGCALKDVQSQAAEKLLPATVHPLRSRWKPGMNFGQFSNATFAAFY